MHGVSSGSLVAWLLQVKVAEGWIKTKLISDKQDMQVWTVSLEVYF